jgi:nitrogen regulatory protein P-II 1
MLRKLEAVVRTERMPHVKKCLEEIGVFGLAVSNIQTWRYEKTPIIPHVENKSDIYDLLPRKKIEIIVAEEQVDSIIDTIKEQARTGGANGQAGDGIIAVSMIEQLSYIGNVS